MIEDEEDTPELPGWGDVYNFDEMHGDYVREPLEEGEEGFYSQMCIDYYAMYFNAEARDAAESEEDEEEEDGEEEVIEEEDVIEEEEAEEEEDAEEEGMY